MLENISVNDLKMLDNINLVDIRSIEKYNNKHIMNAVNIPFEQLIIRPEKYLSRNEKYYIYCQKGIQSRKICQMLAGKGYNVVNVTGGYETWILNE